LSPALAFGNLDPTNPVPVSVSTTIVFTCGGSAPLATFSISSGNGQHFSGGKRRMQNPSDLAVYIPYDLTLTSPTAPVLKNEDQPLTIKGDIAGADYRFATAGLLYADQVILSINP
jgi:spore coat protein U-like protein